MENQKATDIDEMVMARLLRTRFVVAKEETTVAEVDTPTLDTPPTGDVNPMEWLTNPVGLDITPRSQVTWADSGEIVSPITKLRAPALA